MTQVKIDEVLSVCNVAAKIDPRYRCIDKVIFLVKFLKEEKREKKAIRTAGDEIKGIRV